MSVETATEPTQSGIFARFFNEFSFIRGNFLIILIGWLLVDFTREMAWTYYPLYVQALGGSASTVGLIASVAAIIEAIVKIPGGVIADKFRRKNLIITMTFMASFAYLIYAFAPSWHFILLGAVITSLCWIYTPAFDSIIIESLPEENRGTGYSLINLITRASTTPSPLIAGLMFTNFGLVQTSRISFIFVSAAFFIGALLRFRLTEPRDDKQQINARELVKSISGPRSFIEGFSVWKVVPRSLQVLMVIELIFIIPNVMFNTSFVFFLFEELGITEVQLSYLGTTIGVSVILLALPAGKIIDKVGKKKPMMFGYALTAVALPFILGASFRTLMLFTPIIALINVTFFTSMQALAADLIPSEHRGKVSGSRSFFSLVAVSLGGLLGGYVYDYVSHYLSIYLFIFANIPAFILTALYIQDPKKKENKES